MISNGAEKRKYVFVSIRPNPGYTFYPLLSCFGYGVGVKRFITV